MVTQRICSILNGVIHHFCDYYFPNTNYWGEGEWLYMKVKSLHLILPMMSLAHAYHQHLKPPQTCSNLVLLGSIYSL